MFSNIKEQVNNICTRIYFVGIVLATKHIVISKVLREAVKNYLADFFPLRGYPPSPPYPLNGKSFFQKKP